MDDTLELAGVSLNTVEHISELTRFDTVYVPDNSIVVENNDNRYYTKEYKEIISEIFNKIPRTPSTGKIYFTRTALKYQQWKEHGEKVVEREFKRLGYKIVSPEKNSIMQNLTLLRNCEAFASTEGSISHNVLFCTPNTPVAIIRKVNHINTWQLVANHVSGVNVTYIDAHQSIVSKGWTGPFYICVTRQLELFVGHRILHFPHYFRPSFWWYLVQNRRITKRLLQQYHNFKIKWQKR